MTKNPYLMIVNKENLYDESMAEGLNFTQVRDTAGQTYLEEETYKAYLELNEYMKETFGVALFLTSAGRSLKQQQELLDFFIKRDGEKAAYERVALPGTSEHHTGLALDVKPEYARSEALQKLTEKALQKAHIPEKIAYPKQPTEAQRNEMYRALAESATDFGFIIRYTEEKKDKTGYDPEPWHIRFVGKEHAKNMADANLCLEEYVQSLNNELGDEE